MSDNQIPKSTSAQELALRIGFWAAISGATLMILFVILSLVFVSAPWTGIQAYTSTFKTEQIASAFPGMLLAPTMVLLMASFHYSSPPEKRIFTLVAVAFSSIYTTIISTNYFLEFVVIRLNLLGGELEGLSLLALPNFHSVSFALEVIGYCFLGLATLAVSPVLVGGRLEAWIRWLFIANGAAGVIGVIVVPFDQPMIIFLDLGLWSLLFPTALVLAILFFKKQLNALSLASGNV